jgi:hypothetical protein
MIGLIAPVDPRQDPRPFFRAVVDAIVQLQQPGQPVFVHSVALADLPPAADWPGGVLRVADLDILAVSNGSAWIRQDTGAPIA